MDLFFCGVLSNQHVATFFFLCAVWALVSCRRKGYFGPACYSGSLCIAVASDQAGDAGICHCGGVLYLLYDCVLAEHSLRCVWRGIGRYAAGSAVFLAVIVTIVCTSSALLLELGWISRPLTDSNIQYKIAVGLNRATNGCWNEDDFKNVSNSEELLRRIHERIQEPGQVVSLMFSKLAYQYGTYNYGWDNMDKKGFVSETFYLPLTNGAMLTVLLLAAALLRFSRYCHMRAGMLLVITIIGYFLPLH